MKNTKQIDALMSQAQVFASAWSLVGGPFDSGNALADAECAKAELRKMLEATLPVDSWPTADDLALAYEDAFIQTPHGRIWANLVVLAEALRARRAGAQAGLRLGDAA